MKAVANFTRNGSANGLMHTAIPKSHTRFTNYAPCRSPSNLQRIAAWKKVNTPASAFIPKRLYTISTSTTNATEASTTTYEKRDVDAVVVGCYVGGQLTPAAQYINNATNNELQRQLQLTEFDGKLGSAHIVCLADSQFSGIKSIPRICIVGLGEKEVGDSFDAAYIDMLKERARRAAAAGAKALKQKGAKHIALEPLENSPQSVAEGAALGLYQFSAEHQTMKPPQQQLSLYTIPTDTKTTENEWDVGVKVSAAQNFARTLMDTPANRMTPTIFAETVQKQFAGLNNVTVIARDKQWITEKEMFAFLGVAQGSEQPPVLLEIHYKPLPDTAPTLVLVGKGVTFDSGGINIKLKGMTEMKGDMGGAATVVAATLAAAQNNLPVNITVITPLAENMPSGGSLKPSDTIRSSGKIIEIDNTDAEGRLLLADALHYAHSLNPTTIIDVATLTGAIQVALGRSCYGCFTPDDGLWSKLQDAGRQSGEVPWRMPLFESYKSLLSSTVADIANSGGAGVGGSCSAAIFLKEFVKIKSWAHLDIAGVMSSTGDVPHIPKGMTGIPVRALFEFIRNMSSKK